MSLNGNGAVMEIAFFHAYKILDLHLFSMTSLSLNLKLSQSWIETIILFLKCFSHHLITHYIDVQKPTLRKPNLVLHQKKVVKSSFLKPYHPFEVGYTKLFKWWTESLPQNCNITIISRKDAFCKSVKSQCWSK